ncbi:MAG: stage II sporulation protein M [Turicibacter sp.]|nr:stage II sporulation protein M [Turicibacter sp.]
MKQLIKKYIRNRRKKTRKKSNVSHITRIVLTLLAIVLVGDLIGVLMYVRQTPETRQALVQYFYSGTEHRLTFFETFWQQAIYQLTIWGLGLTIIGNVANGFLLFARGASTGFNLAFIIDISNGTSNLAILMLWSLQAFLMLFTTILSAYFSVRFAYLVAKSIYKKKMKIIKKQLKLYVTQLAVVLVLTIFTSLVTAVSMPIVMNGLRHNEAAEPSQLEIEIGS